MAWFGDGLPSLSNLKGQLTNFTKEVLSDGIVEEIDERSKALNEANQRCVELQEILNSKDAEISHLRRQNCELQKTVVDLNAKPKDSNDVGQDDEDEVFFWDPMSGKNRNSKNQKHARQLQEQLAQATVRIRDLETELKRVQKLSNGTLKEELTDRHQTAEFLRAKQDMVNRIIQMEEKSRGTERSTKPVPSEETALINDFRTVLSKLNSLEKLDLVRVALKALETEHEKPNETNRQEKSDFDEKLKRPDDNETVPSRTNLDVNSQRQRQHDGLVEASSNRESELHKRIEELQEENKRLFASVEELDQQHEESIEKLLSLKEEAEKKHQCLQNAYEQLYVDYNQAQDKVTQLEERLKESTTTRVPAETVSRSVQSNDAQNVDESVQTQDLQMLEEEENKNEKNVIDELTERIHDILRNSTIDTEPNESIFEAVARQYVDTKWKKDLLEKRVTELTRELKEAVEMKDNLQMECDVMQSHIDSLLLKIQDLQLNLPSIPEASEERVASLESETESLHEEVKRLQSENTAFRSENALLREGSVCELRTEGHAQLIAANRSRKSTRLEDIPEAVEETDSATESLNRRLHTTLDENDELRRKIVSLENTERETQEQLKKSLERCKDLDENMEVIQMLKLELETVRRELKASASKAKEANTAWTSLCDVADKLDWENKELSSKNEQLEMEISKWRELDSGMRNDQIIRDLRAQLDQATRKRDELEYDILNMREELDEAFVQLDSKDSCVARLSQENENLTKEKDSLLEQLTDIQDESNGKIDLVNTEKSLLEQERMELKEQVKSSQEEVNGVRERLRETEERYARLEDEFVSMSEKMEQLRSENETRKSEELKSLTEKLNSMQSDYAHLANEVETLRLRERELVALQERFARVTTENEALNGERNAIQDNFRRLEHEVACLQAEKKELLSRVNEGTVVDNEKQQIVELLEERTRENESLKASNDRLMSEVIESQKKLQQTMEGNKESVDMAKETIESLSRLVSEKDEEINSLKKSLEVNKNNTELSDNLLTVKKERDELVKLVTVKHNESLQYHGEIQRLSHLLNEQALQIRGLMAEKDANLSELKEKNTELSWMRNELQTLQGRLHSNESSNKEVREIVENSTQTVVEHAFLDEKCNALEAALIQEQSNNRMLQNQLNEWQSKEANAEKELERLRTHLVEMESSYTEEALLAEETRKELEAKLQQAEEKVKNSSTAYTSANIRANQQVETLQQQMALIIQQRDDIQNKLSIAEDRILSQTASLTNLQIVLEQFQRDKEKDIMVATERIQTKLNESYRKQEELVNDITNLKEQLAEARECLQAASRLSEQLDKKTECIEQLTQEVDRLSHLVNTADRRIEEAKQNGEGKVDKTLVKNLLLGYLSSSAADKSAVLRVFSTILDFDEAERDKAGLNNVAAQNGWFSRLSGGSSVPSKDEEASLSAAFVKFLESESKPKPQLPALPIQTSTTSRPGHSRQHSTSSTQSTLLLSNVNLPTFPDFVPARNTGSILKEVLKNS